MALGIPATQLAKRLGVVPSTISRLEASEADETITLATLRRAADALGCELHYALVPRQPLANTLEARALQLARARMQAISHTMTLEAQATPKATIERQTREIADALLQGPRRDLWREG